MTFLRSFSAGLPFWRDTLPTLFQWRPLHVPLQYGGGFRLPGWMPHRRPLPEVIGHFGATGSFACHAVEADIFLVVTFNPANAPKRPFTFMPNVPGAIEQHGGRA